MKILFLLIFLLPFSSFAQVEFKDIAAKWQEEKRTKKKEKEFDFADTLRLEIRADGFMMIRHSIGPTITGEAEIQGRSLVLEDKKYSIVQYSSSSLVLRDEEAYHHFKKVEEFRSSPVTKVIPGAVEGKKDISLSTIKGKWTVYKKTDPLFDQIKFYLKVIHFKEDKGNGSYSAEVTFNNSDSVYSTDAFIHIKGSDFLISSDHETFKANVMKSDGEEMILQSGSIHYFLKQFGKRE